MAADRVSIEHALEPVYLRGKFRVDVSDHAKPILRPDVELDVGSLPEQGHPFYTGWVTYTGTFEYESEWGPYSLDVGSFDGFAATATVNGTRVGPIGEPSTNDDLSEVLVDGTNDVRISIYVSPENALGPLHHREKPRENGRASPWMFTSHVGDAENFVAPHQVGPAGMHDPPALVRIDDVARATDWK